MVPDHFQVFRPARLLSRCVFYFFAVIFLQGWLQQAQLEPEADFLLK
jgi:hypothetical protein